MMTSFPARSSADDLLKKAKSLPWEERLSHHNWLVRIDANVDLTLCCKSIIDPGDPRLRLFGPLFKKTVADPNPNVQEMALDALIAFLEVADADVNRYAGEVCCTLFSKCLYGYPETLEKSRVSFKLWLELGATEAFLDAVEKVIKNEDAEAVKEAVDVMSQVLSEFGEKVVSPNRILPMLPELCNHKDNNVLASYKSLRCELCRWIGTDQVKSFLLEHFHDSMENELEADLSNIRGIPKPSRKIRYKEVKEPKPEYVTEDTRIVPKKSAMDGTGFGGNMPVKYRSESSDWRTCEAEAAQEFQYLKLSGDWKRKSRQSVFQYLKMVRSQKRSKRTIGKMSIPEEVTSHQIMSRLPVKSLRRFISICKLRQAIIYDSYKNLMTLHLPRRIADQRTRVVTTTQKFQYLKLAGDRKRKRKWYRSELEYLVLVGSQKRRKRMGPRKSLPEEVIVAEILPRLPVKSLMRFKSVCKSWQDIISGVGDSNLITSHLQRSRQQLRVLVTPADQYGFGVVSCHFVQVRSFSFSSCQSEFLLNTSALEAVASTCMPSHCDGLILFSSATELHVCNPATQELVTLPSSTNVNNPSRIQSLFTPYNAAAIGHEQLRNEYKVVRFFYRFSDPEARNCSIGVEVLTLGSHSLCWIPALQDPPYPIWPVESASTSDGFVYWLIDNTLHRSQPQAIMSFNLGDGNFGIIPPPPTWLKNLDSFQHEALISVLDGHLCCTYRGDPLRRICIYSHGTWHVRYSQQVDINKCARWASLPLGTTYDGRILLNVDKSFLYYDPQRQTTELIASSTNYWPTHSHGKEWFHIIAYIESMLPIKQNNMGCRLRS